MRRAIGIAAALCLGAVGSQVSAAPAAKVVVEDPVGDANFVNDQGTGDGSFGDVVTPADVSSVTDLVSIEISNDAKNLFVNFLTEAGPPATQGVGYRLRANPDGAGGGYCIFFEAFYPGAGNDLTAAVAHVRDACEGGDPVEVELLGSMLKIPRKASKAFGKGAVLAAPQAHGFIYTGSYPAGVPYPISDTTTVGKDYKMVDKKKRKK